VKISLPLVALCLAGCGSLLHAVEGQDVQAIVDKRLVGASVGDFFQRYGGPFSREEAPDGSLAFLWEAGFGNVAPGPRGPEEKICRLRLSADKAGRIVAAPILRDGQGERGFSRCAELFG
jgi:hypothetical protein